MHRGLSDPPQIPPRPADPQPPPGPWPAGVHVVAEPGLDVPEGAALNLSCHLPGGPRPTVNSTFAWFWNGRQLYAEPVPTLSFSYVSRAQAGVYHCRAESPTGTTTSAPVTLRVLCEWDTTPCLSFPTTHMPTSGLLLLPAKSKDFTGMESWTDGLLLTSCASVLWFPHLQMSSPHLVRRLGEKACRRPATQ